MIVSGSDIDHLLPGDSTHRGALKGSSRVSLLSFHALDALNDAHEPDAEGDSAAEGRRTSR